MYADALRGRVPAQVQDELKQLGLLTRVFFRRITDSELVSQQGELSVTFSHVLAFIALPGMLAPLLVMPKYSYLATLPERIREPYTWDDKLFFVSLAMQLILTFFVLAGMRMVFTIPAELRANWVFQLAVTEEPRAWQRGVRKAMFYCGVLPVLILLFPVHVAMWGWSAAIFHLGFGYACAVLLIDALLLGFTKIPFTCAYLPGRARMTVRWPFYWLAFTVYGYGMASIEGWIMDGAVVRIAFAAAILLASIAALRILNQRSVRNRALLYDEEPEPYLCTLELNRVP